MITIHVSEDIVTLIRLKQSNIEYFINETLGYIDGERGKQLKDKISIRTNKTVSIVLSDDLCKEIQSNFDECLPLSQAVNIILLCGYLFGGI